MIYLSYVLSEDTPTYGDKGLCIIEQVKKILKGDSSNNSQLHISSHTGTHIDAPYHFCSDGKTIDTYPPEFWFCNRPYLIDTNISDIIRLDSIKDQLDQIPDSTDILLFRSGFEKSRDSQNKSQYIFNNPGIEAKIGFWLRENKSIKIIGMDFISLSSYVDREEGRCAHRAFLCPYEKEGITFDPILIVEDMKLAHFDEKLNNIIVMPLRTQNGDGAPVTVIGW